MPVLRVILLQAGAARRRRLWASDRLIVGSCSSCAGFPVRNSAAEAAAGGLNYPDTEFAGADGLQRGRLQSEHDCNEPADHLQKGHAMKRRLAGLAALLVAAAAAQAESYPPEAGTDRESAAYLASAEAYLESLDLDDPRVSFRQLGGTTATNWAVRIGDQSVADLKCTSGNTDHHGAVIAYRLGRELGFDVYPVAVYRDIDRTIGDRRIAEQCALKEWATVFTQYYWTRDTFADTDSRDKQKLIAALQCDSPKPATSEPFRYYARSAYGDPGLPGVRRVPYSGDSNLLTAARDFSNMMVIDTLIGNEDRFPGGNMFFRSVDTSHRVVDGAVIFDNVRLFSLDNEAAFKGATPASTHAAKDLAKYVSRFDAQMIANIRELAADDERLAAITDGDAVLAAFIREGIGLVLERYEAAHARCGESQAAF